MYIHIGEGPYGTCDVVPDLFYVATWFGHFDLIPIIPLRTNLVLGKVGNNYHVVKIPLSIKSIFLAWVRLATFGAFAGVAIVGFIAYSDNGGLHDALSAWALAGFFAIVFAFFMVYPRRKMPSYARACHLAQLAQLNDTQWAALNVLYGRDPFDRPPAAGTSPFTRP